VSENNNGDKNRFDKVNRKGGHEVRHGSSKNFADAHLFVALFSRVSGQPKQSETGDDNRHEGEDRKETLHSYFGLVDRPEILIHK
jgi:hypothetical protein